MYIVTHMRVVIILIDSVHVYEKNEKSYEKVQNYITKSNDYIRCPVQSDAGLTN